MTTATATPDELRRSLADQLTDDGAIASPQWHRAFATVPREIFVPAFTVRTPEGRRAYRDGEPGWLPTVYSDVSLLTQTDAHGTTTSSSSQPSAMARMLEALDVADGHKVLEVGTGTGYNAALLAHRLGGDRVYSIDVDPTLVSAARAALTRAGYSPTLTAGDGMRGWLERAPFDRLIATCGVHRIPDAWRTQMRRDGVMVANLGLGIARLTVGDDYTLVGGFLPTPAAFMTARATAGDDRPPAGRQAADLVEHAAEQARDITLPADLGGLVPQFLGGLAQPTVEQLLLGEHRYLVHQRSGSWARIVPGAGAGARLEHGGPRDLWAELEPVLTSWVEAGQPGMEEYELRVAADGTHVLRCGSRTWPLRAADL
ncbi:MAG: methyltransferase domain-containing protein [Streptomyces sp.]|nr:methyltransferase domain-containing protein [Streptomyces sp.]